MWRKFRLRHPSDFKRLRHEGHVSHHAWVLLSVAPNDLGRNRYGFITSKGVGKAVVRNRVRRLLREVTRHYHPRLTQGLDIVAIARQRIVGHSYAEIVHQLQKLYEQAGLLVKKDEQR